MDKQTYAVLKKKIDNVTENIDEVAAEATDAWLSENIDPATGYVLDSTLSLDNAAPPASAVGDLKTAFILERDKCNRSFFGLGNFQHYGLNADGTFLMSQKYRVSCDNTQLITFDRDVAISVADGFRWGYIPFVNNAAGSWSGWITSRFVIPKGTEFVVQIARTVEDSSEIADVNEFVSAVTFDSALIDYINDFKDGLFGLSQIDLKDRFSWVVGGLDWGTAGHIYTGYKKRICTKKGLKFDVPVSVNIVSNNIQYAVWLLESDDLDTANYHGSIYEKSRSFVIPAGRYFAVMALYIDETGKSNIPDPYTSEPYQGISITPINPDDNIVITPSMFRQGSHQADGYYPSESKRITTVIKANVKSGDMLSVKTNGLYFGIRLFSEYMVQIKAIDWMSPNSGYLNYVFKDEAPYITIDVANGGSYSSSTSITVDDFTQDIYIYRNNGYVDIQDMKDNTQVSTYNALGLPTTHIQNFAKLYKTTGHGDGFVFFTDMHVVYQSGWESRLYECLSYIEAISKSAPVSFVISGGDWLGSNDTQDEALYMLSRISGYMEAKFHGNYVMLLGNHDTNYQGYIDGTSREGGTADGRLTQDAIDNTYSKAWRKSYYTFEAPTFIMYCFDTGIEATTLSDDYYSGQVAWFAESLLHETHEHIALGFHILLNNSVIQPLANAITECANAYNSRSTYTYDGTTYDYTDATGTVSFAIAGHTHSDSTGTANSIPYIVTTNAAAYGSYSTLPLDLCAVDWDAGKLYAYRATIGGTGSVRELNILT